MSYDRNRDGIRFQDNRKKKGKQISKVRQQ